MVGCLKYLGEKKWDIKKICKFMLDEKIKYDNNNNILDLCCGTGMSTIPGGIGIDTSKEMLNVAKKNAKKHNIHNIQFKVRSFIDICNYKFDLIVSNPPYIQTKEIKNLQEDIKKIEELIKKNLLMAFLMTFLFLIQLQ